MAYGPQHGPFFFQLALVTAPTVQWMAASSIKARRPTPDRPLALPARQRHTGLLAIPVDGLLQISRHKPVALAYHDDLTSNHDWL